jgi:hypothetical protein
MRRNKSNQNVGFNVPQRLFTGKAKRGYTFGGKNPEKKTEEAPGPG